MEQNKNTLMNKIKGLDAINFSTYLKNKYDYDIQTKKENDFKSLIKLIESIANISKNLDKQHDKFYRLDKFNISYDKKNDVIYIKYSNLN